MESAGCLNEGETVEAKAFAYFWPILAVVRQASSVAW